MTFEDAMEASARFFEAVGVVALFLGLFWAIYVGIRAGRRGELSGVRAFREVFGSSILLALEVLVAADLIRTVAIAPSIENVTVLAIIVLIRTVLSFSLETEIEGVPPWRRAMVTGGERVIESSRRGLGPEGKGRPGDAAT
ncbi:MAG TPA: DUF1622 domain-containing protein [Actinomycetes bacterium]|nr:DUF1622 domain-containing protein [Actinomycetes bacterium]